MTAYSTSRGLIYTTPTATEDESEQESTGCGSE